MQNNQDKDFSLLRPFDLEAAKRGELVCWHNDGTKARYVGKCGMDDENDICVEYLEDCFDVTAHTFVMHESDYFRMSPLCWIEGKPVYKDDVLYNNIYPEFMYIVDYVQGDMVYTQDNETGSFREYTENLTWEKPKKIRNVWFNLYESDNSNNINTSISFDSEQSAIEAQGNYDLKFIKRICVELEE